MSNLQGVRQIASFAVYLVSMMAKLGGTSRVAMKRLTKSPIPVIRTHAIFIFVFGSQASIVMMMVLSLPESGSFCKESNRCP